MLAWALKGDQPNERDAVVHAAKKRCYQAYLFSLFISMEYTELIILVTHTWLFSLLIFSTMTN